MECENPHLPFLPIQPPNRPSDPRDRPEVGTGVSLFAKQVQEPLAEHTHVDLYLAVDCGLGVVEQKSGRIAAVKDLL